MKRTFPYLLSSAAYVAGIGLIISSAWLITTASFRPPLMTLGMAIVGVRFFGISRSAARYFERLTSHRQVFDRLSQLRVRLFEALTANPQTSNSLRLVRDESSGTLVKRVVDDIERVQEYELRITMPHVAGAISVLIAVVLGGWILPISLIITLPVSVLLLFVMPFFIKARCERLARRIEVLENDYATLVQQALHGMAEAQFYGYLSERLQQTQQMEEEIMQEEKSLLRANSKFAFFTVAAFGAVLVSLAWMAQSSAHAIPAVKVSMIIFLPLVMFEAVTLWYPNLLGAGKLLLARDEVSEIIDAEKIKEESRTSLSKPITQVVAREVSFSVAAGGSLVIRGRSGVGKSTLAMALLGLLDYDGEILLNGIDLRLIENVPVAGTIQSSHIFNTSLRENLKIAASDADDMELVAVLGKVELDLLLTQLPDGLDTIIGQFGRALSGGEAKRLSLARALLSKAEVLVLDEPTEHLDHDLAVRLERRILEMNRILIVITHSGWESASATLQLVR
jgi:thiol reductant ABC exporter CydC subunit